LIKTLLEQEKTMKEFDKANVYQTINQIFSFVLQESGWKMGANSNAWDVMPLEVMSEAFPKISSTKWYAEQTLMTQQNIEVKIKD
jgi:hypothetical protein